MLGYFLLVGLLIVYGLYIKYFFKNNRTVSEDLPLNVKKNLIIDFLTRSGYPQFVPRDKYVSNIYDAYFNNIFKSKMGHTVHYYYALYHRIKQDHHESVKFHLLAIESGRPDYMHNFGSYYSSIGDYKNAEKYYLMAIDKQFSYSTSDIGFVYQKNKDFINMKKYYYMAIENDIHRHINNFLDYIANYKDTTALHKIFEIKPTLFNDDKYVNKIIETLIKENGCTPELITMIDYIDIGYFTNPSISHIMILCKKLISKKIELLDLHFNYSPEGKGYLAAKCDFIKQLVK